MPTGVETFVDGEGFAVLDFVDPARRGPALAKLIEIGGPESIETITRDGPRRKYRVPEGNASAAGLIDSPVKATAHGDLKFAQALARENPQDNPRTHRPDLPDGRYGRVEPVAQKAVLSNQSISTTEGGEGPPAEAVAPTHTEVIAKIQADRNRGYHDREARRSELDTPVRFSGNPTIASQTGALATDPQSRAGVTVRRPPAELGAINPRYGGPPSKAWTRAQIDAHAADVHGIDTTGAATKQEALDQIEGAKS